MTEFLKINGLAHEVMLEGDKQKKGPYKYQGSSPDEIVLVEKAAELGLVYKETKNNIIHAEMRSDILSEQFVE